MSNGSGYGAVCDDFYVSSRLFLKIEMTLEPEAVLHFFDRIRKEYPTLRKLRRREAGAFTLEDEADEHGSRHWIRLDANSLRFGHFAPPDLDAVRRFGGLILAQAPYHLTFSDLAYDHLELIYGFDLRYRGNHDQLVAETLCGEHAAAGLLFGDQAMHIIDAQPYFGIALTPECDLQAYVEVKSRTSTFEVRSGNFEGEPISVFLTLRKYWGMNGSASPADVLPSLFDTADELATDKVVPSFVNPLAAAIASRS
jgi:hypothetical protein